MPFYVFAWIASIAYGFDIVMSKLTSKHAISNPWLFNFLWTFMVILFTLPPAFASHVGIPHDWSDILVAAFLGALASIFFVLALYKLDVSVLAPLFNFRSVFTVALGALFVCEILTQEQR